MKLETKYKDASIGIEFTPEEIGKLTPFSIRAFFNIKTVTIKIYCLLRDILIECQKNNGWKKFALEKYYLKDERVTLLVEQMPFFIKNSVKNKFIKEYDINSYEQSNIFFATMDLFLNKLRKNDIKKIFERFVDNNQTSLVNFLEEIKKEKPKLLTSQIEEYLRIEKLKIESENT